MTNILKKISDDKIDHVEEQKKLVPLSTLEDLAKLASPTRSFHKSLNESVLKYGIGLIAEIKKASPSKGLIRNNFNPSVIAKEYLSGGASCISVLTDKKYFQGDDKFIKEVQSAVSLPVLRKDFILDTYQVTESRALGADCILVILAAVGDSLAKEIIDAANHWNMDKIVEVHNLDEMERAANLNSELIGINNRDLKSLEIDLKTSEILASYAPESADLISESGINSKSDINYIKNIGISRFLIGTSFMIENDIGSATRSLLS